MATTDLKLEECGSLPKPGPVGRLVRLAFGALCLNFVYALWMTRGSLMTDAGSLRLMLWVGTGFGLFLISYVVNIGFSKAWGKRPRLVSAVIILGFAISGQLQTGSFETLILAQMIHLWLLYIFTHLGTAFVIACIIATPGCEMRAFHHLYTLITGTPTLEHICPVGPLKPIDNWEAKQSWHKPAGPN